MAAIYQPKNWNAYWLTTTLYPVEATDSLEVSVTLSGGFLSPIPASDLTSTQTLLDGSYTQLRWFYSDGPYDSDLTSSQTLLDGTYTQLRWFYYDGPYDSDLESTQVMLDGTYVSKLVVADSPDEELQLALTINNTCSMDLI